MKPLYKKLLLGGFGLVIILYIIGSFSNSDTTENIQSQSNDVNNIGLTDSAPTSELNVNQDVSGLFTVTKVIDGDTLSIDMVSKIETIRLIGLNTPETVDPRKPVECFGKQASNKAKELLSGKKIKIEKDPSQGDYDKYQRLLAYVFLEDGTNFNKWMIENGYGYEYTYNLPYKYQKEFKLAQEQAKAQKRGLWADDVCQTETKAQTTTTQTTQIQTQTAPAPTTSNKYICTYNTYNCGDFSTHNEAQSVYEDCGGVNNDVHRLDQDKDGLACETLP